MASSDTSAALPRIDRGVERGSRPPDIPHWRKQQDPAESGSSTIPADLDPDDVIERYLTEATTATIAKSYGLRRSALTRWLRNVRPDKWREAMSIRALATKEDAGEEMKGAVSALSLSRAREVWRASHADLQCLDPDYRPQIAAVQINIGAGLGDRLQRAEERLVDGGIIGGIVESDKS